MMSHLGIPQPPTYRSARRCPVCAVQLPTNATGQCPQCHSTLDTADCAALDAANLSLETWLQEYHRRLVTAAQASGANAPGGYAKLYPPIAANLPTEPLANAHRCPVCAEYFTTEKCSHCGFDVQDPSSLAVWEAATAADQWQTHRHELAHKCLPKTPQQRQVTLFDRESTAEATMPGPPVATETAPQVATEPAVSAPAQPSAPTETAPPATSPLDVFTPEPQPTIPVAASKPTPTPPGAPQPAATPSSRRFAIPHEVNLGFITLSLEKFLVALGALLVSAAVLVFIATSWESMTLTTRAITLATITALVAAGAHRLRNQNIPATAEAFAAIASTSFIADLAALGWVLELRDKDISVYLAASGIVATALFTLGAKWSKFASYQGAAALLVPLTGAATVHAIGNQLTTGPILTHPDYSAIVLTTMAAVFTAATAIVCHPKLAALKAVTAPLQCALNFVAPLLWLYTAALTLNSWQQHESITYPLVHTFCWWAATAVLFISYRRRPQHIAATAPWSKYVVPLGWAQLLHGVCAALLIGPALVPFAWGGYAAGIGPALVAAALLVRRKKTASATPTITTLAFFCGALLGTIPAAMLITATFLTALPYGLLPTRRGTLTGLAPMVSPTNTPELGFAALVLGGAALVTTVSCYLVYTWPNIRLHHCAPYLTGMLVVGLAVGFPMPIEIRIAVMVGAALASIWRLHQHTPLGGGQLPELSQHILTSSCAVLTGAICLAWGYPTTWIAATGVGLAALTVAAFRFTSIQSGLVFLLVSLTMPFSYRLFVVTVDHPWPLFATAVLFSAIAWGFTWVPFTARGARATGTWVAATVASISSINVFVTNVYGAADLLPAAAVCISAFLAPLAAFGAARHTPSGPARTVAYTATCYLSVWTITGMVRYLRPDVIANTPALFVPAALFVAMLMIGVAITWGRHVRSEQVTIAWALGVGAVVTWLPSIFVPQNHGAVLLLVAAWASAAVCCDDTRTVLVRRRAGLAGLLGIIAAVWWFMRAAGWTAIEVHTWPLAAALATLAGYRDLTTCATKLTRSVSGQVRGYAMTAMALATWPTALLALGETSWRSYLVIAAALLWPGYYAATGGRLLTRWPGNAIGAVATTAVVLFMHTPIAVQDNPWQLWPVTALAIAAYWGTLERSSTDQQVRNLGYTIAPTLLIVPLLPPIAEGNPVTAWWVGLLLIMLTASAALASVLHVAKTTLYWGCMVALGSATVATIFAQPASAPKEFVLIIAGLAGLSIAANPQIRNSRSSFVWSAPQLLVLFAPTLWLETIDADIAWDVHRLAYLLVLAAVVLLVGVHWQLLAPTLIGTATLATVAVVKVILLTNEQEVNSWVTLGIVGMVLLFVGTTMEKRFRDIHAMRRHLAQYR